MVQTKCPFSCAHRSFRSLLGHGVFGQGGKDEHCQDQSDVQRALNRMNSDGSPVPWLDECQILVA